MKKCFLVLSALMAPIAAFACDACKKQQPEFLQAVGHGGGPESDWDYLIVTVMVIITTYVLVATFKCLFKPTELGNDHVKRMILKD